MNPNPVGLSYLNRDAQIFVAAYKHKTATRMIACEFNHIRNNQRIYTLLLAKAIDRTETQLDVIRVCESYVLSSRLGSRGIIPIDSEDFAGAVSFVLRELDEGFDDLAYVEDYTTSPRFFEPCYRLSASCQKVAGVNENSDSCHKRHPQ